MIEFKCFDYLNDALLNGIRLYILTNCLTGIHNIAGCVIFGIGLYLSNCHISNASFRLISNAMKRYTIIRIEEELQHSKRIFDFFAIKEAEVTNNAVWHSTIHHCHFQRSAHAVDAIEDSNVFLLIAPSLHKRADSG